MCTYMYICIYTHIYICIYIYTHTYIYVGTHVSKLVLNLIQLGNFLSMLLLYSFDDISCQPRQRQYRYFCTRKASSLNVMIYLALHPFFVSHF